MRPLLVLTLLSLGCGGSSLSDRIANYRSTTSALEASVQVHVNAKASAAPDTCAAAMADYAQRAGGLVDRMRAMSGEFDQCMSSLGRTDRADLAADCAAIRGEIDAHVRSGCSAPDLPAELSRHAAAMEGHLSHQLDRMGEMESMGNDMGSPMMGSRQGCF